MTPARRLQRVEQQLADTRVALQRLTFILDERGLLSADERAVVDELLTEAREQPAPPRTPKDPPRRSTRRTTGTSSGPSASALPPKSRSRSQIGRLGAHTKWATTEDRTAATAPARAGMQRKFEDQVDPDRSLPPVERARRVESARRAHYQRLALASAKARAAKKAAKKGGGAGQRRPDDDA